MDQSTPLIEQRGSPVPDASNAVEDSQGRLPPLPESEAKLKAQQEADAKLQADVMLGAPNIYVSVLVAEFGGVDIRLNSSSKIKVHPIVLLLLSLPVFSAQISILLFLRVSAIDTFFIDNKMDLNLDVGTADGKVKVLMIAIASMTNFEGLVITVQHFIFILNPLTWIEVARPNSEQWIGKRCSNFKFCFDGVFFMPVALVAATMNLIVTYTICTDVANVVMGSEDGKDAIFNCLALAFVADLGASWWAFVSYILHIEPIDGFEFTLADNVWENGSDELTDNAKSGRRFLGVVNFLLSLTGKRIGLEYSFLRTGHGARRSMHLLSVFGVAYIYLRQVFVVLRAIAWGFIPAVPDLCAQNAILQQGWARWLGDTLLAITVDTLQEELDDSTRRARGATFNEFCLAPPEVFPLALKDLRGCFTQHSHTNGLPPACPDYGPRAAIYIIVAVIAMMLVPTFGSLLHGFVSRKPIAPVQTEELGKGASTEEYEASAMPAEIEARMRELEERLAKLEKR